jgi:hypothetical protein
MSTNLKVFGSKKTNVIITIAPKKWEEMILSDDESRSSDSKRSKLIGHIFNRKQKGKENMKPIKGSDSKENGDITGAIIDACEHITKTYKQPISCFT